MEKSEDKKMSLEEVLTSFDVNRKGFFFDDVTLALRNVDDDSKKLEHYQYELLAFDLRPNSDNKDNPYGQYYYGPFYISSGEKGDTIVTPPFSAITSDAIAYWEKRSYIAENPLLKMRYAGLVFVFKKNISGEKVDGIVYRTYVDSMLNVCNGDYAEHPTITVDILERVFEITMGQESYLSCVKQAYRAFESRHNSDNCIRFWASQFLLMLEHPKSFTQEEVNSLVKAHNERLTRLTTPDDNGNLNPWNVEKQATLLARYYSSIHQVQNLERVLKSIETAFLSQKERIAGIQMMANLETLHQQYRQYGFEDNAKNLAVHIEEAGKSASKNMQLIQSSYKVSIQEYQDRANELFGIGQQTDSDRWANFITYFIPRGELMEQKLKEQNHRHPFLKYFGAIHLLDHKGRPMSQIGTYDVDPEGQLIHYMSLNLQIESFFLSIAIECMKNCGAIEKNKLIDELISKSSLFESDRFSIIEEALYFYFLGNYSVFCHLIIPQIENAIRNLVEIYRLPVIKAQNKKGYQLYTLDDLLRTSCITEQFCEDGAFYLRLVLTDQRALNLRNLLCHGIYPPNHFGESAANRLFHVLMMVGAVGVLDVE